MAVFLGQGKAILIFCERSKKVIGQVLSQASSTYVCIALNQFHCNSQKLTVKAIFPKDIYRGPVNSPILLSFS